MPSIAMRHKPRTSLVRLGLGATAAGVLAATPAVVQLAPGSADAATLASTAGRRAAPHAARRFRPPAEPATPLRLGSRGRAVAAVQRALRIHISGRFTRATRRAVIRFQHRHHLKVDGIVGPQTWDALFHLRPARRAVVLIRRTPEAVGAPAANEAQASTASASAPEATAAPASSYGSASATSYGGSGGYSIPASIVMCESGGNYAAVNPTTGAGGAYQILPSTWAAYGGQGLPQDAPPAEQNRIAAEIYATQGPSAWTC
jgi:peptidoglycan hydrolase-like protein with peptidoglycan-binding domain